MNLTDQQKNNLLVFLDRVEIKGLKELQAMNEILTSLQDQEVPAE
jgi:hypothetical protein